MGRTRQSRLAHRLVSLIRLPLQMSSEEFYVKTALIELAEDFKDEAEKKNKTQSLTRAGCNYQNPFERSRSLRSLSYTEEHHRRRPRQRSPAGGAVAGLVRARPDGRPA